MYPASLLESCVCGSHTTEDGLGLIQPGRRFLFVCKYLLSLLLNQQNIFHDFGSCETDIPSDRRDSLTFALPFGPRGR